MLCVMIGLAGCRTEETKAAVTKLDEKAPVVVQPVTRVSANQVIMVSGALEADKTARLSFLVPGKIDRVHVDEGDYVKRNALLAAVQSHDYRGNLEIAEAALFRARDAHDRYEPLYKEGAFAEKNFIEVKTGLAQARARRDIARKALADVELRSPISGIVGRRSVEVGQMASPRTPAFTIVKTHPIFARVAIPESEIGKVTVGQKARVTIPAFEGFVAKGAVTLIGVVADERTRTYAVKIKLSNRDYTLRPGMIVQAEIVTDKAIEMLTIPGRAIVRDADNLTYVFVADAEKGMALRRRVSPGSAYQTEIQIREGVTAEDVVIVSGQHKLTDGAAITMKELEE
ncbi:MAG: efflux RND transporter periplasmic adaptor subunit [Desulfobacterales bacterium]|nr:efflux RND transporter periplasmic adaptor subunit [Desulfobacterales bacterium]